MGEEKQNKCLSIGRWKKKARGRRRRKDEVTNHKMCVCLGGRGNKDREGEEVRALRTSCYRITSSQLDGTTTGSILPWLKVLCGSQLL